MTTNVSTPVAQQWPVTSSGARLGLEVHGRGLDRIEPQWFLRFDGADLKMSYTVVSE